MDVYWMTSYINWMCVIQLLQRVKTYGDAKFNQPINLIYNHMCTGLPKEGCVTLDESPNITK